MKKLYTSTVCPYCEKVKNYMKEDDIKDVEIVNISEDSESRNYLMMNGGMMQVPCLEHDGEFLYESDDIIEYLRNNK